MPPRSDFIEPCLPSTADQPPSGPEWVHEIKHDGYRLMAKRDPVGIWLLTRRGNDRSERFPRVVEAANLLRVRSCLIDGEVVCCNDKGVVEFQQLRQKRQHAHAFLIAFDLLELNGTDLRREPIETRKATLLSVFAAVALAFSSISIWRIPVTRSSVTPARWGLRASSRSDWARPTDRAAATTGSS
jgi:bifunctional non-homologous end joining protein LigD